MEELKAQVESLREALKDKDRELESKRLEMEEAGRVTDANLSDLARQLEEAKLTAELSTFRALEALRTEHKRTLEREEDQASQGSH